MTDKPETPYERYTRARASLLSAQEAAEKAGDSAIDGCLDALIVAEKEYHAALLEYHKEKHLKEGKQL